MTTVPRFITVPFALNGDTLDNKDRDAPLNARKPTNVIENPIVYLIFGSVSEPNERQKKNM